MISEVVTRNGVGDARRLFRALDLNGDGRMDVVHAVANTDYVHTWISNGNGTFNVVIGPVASGTYTLEFIARNGAGCGLVGGGACDTNHAEADFQSPGPFGTTTTISIP